MQEPVLGKQHIKTLREEQKNKGEENLKIFIYRNGYLCSDGLVARE